MEITNGEMKKSFSAKISIGRKILIFLTLLIVVIFWLTTLLASAMYMYLDETDDIFESNALGLLIEEEVYPDEMTAIITGTLEIYRSIPEEVRQNRLSEEYLSNFDKLKTPEYEKIRDKLNVIAKRHDYDWIHVLADDSANERSIFVFHTNSEDEKRSKLGYWEQDDETIAYYEVSDAELSESERHTKRNNILITIDNIFTMIKNTDKEFATVVPYAHPDTGETIGYLAFGEHVDHYLEHRSQFRYIFFILMIVLLVLILLITSLIVRREIVKPITFLARAARNYVTNREKYKSGSYFDAIRIHTNDEVRVLRDSMSSMEKDINNYIANLTDMVAERERTAIELEFGARIQKSMLPGGLDVPDGLKGVDIASAFRPAKEVGGDFYDYYIMDENHLAVTIADVSGKGVPAALFMVVVKTLLKMAGGSELSPSEIMTKVNRQLCENNSELMFVTVWLGVYCSTDRTLKYVNAGHECHVIYTAVSDAFEIVKEEHDMVLGVNAMTAFSQHEVVLNPGDKVYLYTDGVPEAVNADKDQYGIDRMLKCLNANKKLQGRELLEAVNRDVDEFAKSESQFDDMTSVLIEIS